MSIKLLWEHYLVFLSLKESYTGSSEYTFVKLSLCWKPHDMAQLLKSPVCLSSVSSYSLVVLLHTHGLFNPTVICGVVLCVCFKLSNCLPQEKRDGYFTSHYFCLCCVSCPCSVMGWPDWGKSSTIRELNQA